LEGVFITGRNEWDVYQREFLDDENGETRSTKWKTIWNENDINYQNAKNELKELFEESPFDFPKPLYLLKKLVEGVTSDTDLVMDFFAGSGTTAHAVMAQNSVDGDSRNFILVQLPEILDASNKLQESAALFCEKIGKNKVISELTKERVRRSATKVKRDNPMFVGDVGFRAFRLAHSNIRAWEPDGADIEGSLFKNTEHLVPGRKEQDVLYELLLKLGLDLCVPIEAKSIAGKTVHSIGGGALIACLADDLTKDVIEPLSAGIVAWIKELAPAVDARVVFKDSGFADDIAKTNMAAILNQNGISDVRSL
jgi:adenine-specific DNA-methyltransferase